MAVTDTNLVAQLQSKLDAVTGATSNSDMVLLAAAMRGMAVDRTIFDAELQARITALDGSETDTDLLMLAKSIEVPVATGGEPQESFRLATVEAAYDIKQGEGFFLRKDGKVQNKNPIPAPTFMSEMSISSSYKSFGGTGRTLYLENGFWLAFSTFSGGANSLYCHVMDAANNSVTSSSIGSLSNIQNSSNASAIKHCVVTPDDGAGNTIIASVVDYRYSSTTYRYLFGLVINNTTGAVVDTSIMNDWSVNPSLYAYQANVGRTLCNLDATHFAVCFFGTSSRGYIQALSWTAGSATFTGLGIQQLPVGYSGDHTDHQSEAYYIEDGHIVISGHSYCRSIEWAGGNSFSDSGGLSTVDEDYAFIRREGADEFFQLENSANDLYLHKYTYDRVAKSWVKTTNFSVLTDAITDGYSADKMTKAKENVTYIPGYGYLTKHYLPIALTTTYVKISEDLSTIELVELNTFPYSTANNRIAPLVYLPTTQEVVHQSSLTSVWAYYTPTFDDIQTKRISLNLVTDSLLDTTRAKPLGTASADIDAETQAQETVEVGITAGVGTTLDPDTYYPLDGQYYLVTENQGLRVDQIPWVSIRDVRFRALSDYNAYAFLKDKNTTSSGEGTWRTISDVSGAGGFLTAVVTEVNDNTTPKIANIRITVDGDVFTIIGSTQSTTRTFWGVDLFSNSHGDLYQHSTHNSVITGETTVYGSLHVSSAQHHVMAGHGHFVRFNKSLKVEIYVETIRDVDDRDDYSGAAYILDSELTDTGWYR